ncbi:MAG: hypothetical protein K8R48_02010 [Alphaproteobacteria bacterium]|nr:hypothetical protein [Alphaproteobacteria bacterium]
MNGYKLPHGLLLDAKLAVVARRAGLRRGEALALWIALLDHASRNTPRGSVENIDAEEIAAALEFDPAAIDAALGVLRDKQMISANNAIAGWEKMQTGASTPRTRAHRARQRKGVPQEENDGDDSEAAASRRRQRLRDEMLARHRKRGHIMTENPPAPKQF